MAHREARMFSIFLSLVVAVGSHQVAAPASDILSGIVRLPDPASAPSTSRAAILPLRFRRVPGVGWSADAAVPVDRSGPLSMAMLSPDAGSWKLSTGRPLVLERTLAPVGEEMPGWIVDRYDTTIDAPGTLSVRVDADDPSGARPPAEGWFFAKTSSGIAAEAWLSTLEAVAGNDLEIVARETSGRGRVENARALVEGSTGPVELRMDASADGTFRAALPESVRGDVRARVELRGTADGGFPFLLTVPMSFPVLEREVALEGGARAEVVDDLHLAIEIGALRFGFMDRFHTSAEVWGTNAEGVLVPVCWLSRIDASFTLTLDARWIALAGAHAPFELREVRVQDPATDVVLDRVARMRLDVGALPDAASRRVRSVEPDMLTGRPIPEKTAVGLSPSLMLVHGYCSSGSIWPAADFTQPKTAFLDPNANRTHDQFAQLIAQQAQAAGLTSFGVVTHSQGGCAALHLLTYYTSGLDLARHGRKIQSLAAPYQGTPLASLGIFACGVNNDMTPSGSATWLAGIPTWARAEVYFWTTSNSGSVCNSLTELFLADPNDGTVEMNRAQLPGGNSMGHTVGWCHTTGMSNPASYTDHTRNQAMNAAAAR
jgi:hypothetical protein